jgi:hypothetical protein
VYERERERERERESQREVAETRRGCGSDTTGSDVNQIEVKFGLIRLNGNKKADTSVDQCGPLSMTMMAVVFGDDIWMADGQQLNDERTRNRGRSD